MKNTGKYYYFLIHNSKYDGWTAKNITYKTAISRSKDFRKDIHSDKYIIKVDKNNMKNDNILYLSTDYLSSYSIEEVPNTRDLTDSEDISTYIEAKILWENDE